ncbi:MAG: signal recognition particle subunit SRP19/SEC65 family protein [Sulfolobales archaeon]|jgi:signal recognition particle subunit SRP19
MKKIIIWLPYLDPSLPRRLGRRIPKNILPRKPSLEEILEACKELNLECEVEKEKKYPRTWYIESPRVIIYYNGKKSDLLKILVNNIRNKILMKQRK